jgi:hypothetical protein
MKKEKPETKLCKHCKTEIPYDAKICPNCKKKQGMSGCLVVIIVIVVLGIIGAILGGDGNKSTPDNNTSEPQQTQNTLTDEDNNANEETQNEVTMGQKNALSKGKSYLSISAFSYSGLIKQLEYEGFSTEESTYAAENCGADWNEQAAKKAETYLDISSFSRSGLIEQLEYEGFTSDQAEYGVQAVGY